MIPLILVSAAYLKLRCLLNILEKNDGHIEFFIMRQASIATGSLRIKTSPNQELEIKHYAG
jgi:hypothetical protein